MAWSSGASGGADLFAFSAGGPTEPLAEVEVTDADADNVRVTRRPRPQ